MRLLFDQNLSPKLVHHLVDLYPDSCHVWTLKLDASPDDDLWSFARDSGYVIVSKDSDFGEISLARGAPPKLIWMRAGNCSDSPSRSSDPDASCSDRGIRVRS